MSSHLSIRVTPTNAGHDGSCRECGAYWYSNIIDGWCPECLARFSGEDDES